MAWSTPTKAVAGNMATAATWNASIKANMDALDTHAHAGAAGDGNDELSGLDYVTLDDLAANPTTAGRLQRNGANLVWGAGNYVITNEDPAAGTAGLRSLGTGAQQAAAGDHTH